MLSIRIPDVVSPIEVADETLTNEEIRQSLSGLYPVVANATVSRTGKTVTFTRPTGGTKGL